MSKFPSLPLFTDAWVADTKHLTRLERGTYHDLIVLTWRSPDCRVPNDDDWLARRLGMTLTEVCNELRPLVDEFMQTDGNWLFQKRLTKEWEWCKKNSKQRSDAAKSRWEKENDACKRNADTPAPRNAPILSSPTEESHIDKPPRARKRVGPIPAEWSPPQRAFDLAIELTVNVREVEPRFLDYLASTGKQYADYDAAFCNFIRNARRFNDSPRSYVNGKTKATLADRARELADQVESVERARGVEPEDDIV